MKPKLIILNGPLGIGKTTLAKRYAQDHPMTLMLDVDDVRATISHWREQNDASAILSKRIAIEMARVALQGGHDVVVPQILQTNELADSFQQIAEECNAGYFEILLLVDKTEAIHRFTERSKRQGHPSGFREGGLIATGGREQKLSEMYDNMIAVADLRLHVKRIEPAIDQIEETYDELVAIVSI